jgi:hypothetical protein
LLSRWCAKKASGLLLLGLLLGCRAKQRALLGGLRSLGPEESTACWGLACIGSTVREGSVSIRMRVSVAEHQFNANSQRIRRACIDAEPSRATSRPCKHVCGSVGSKGCVGMCCGDVCCRCSLLRFCWCFVWARWLLLPHRVTCASPRSLVLAALAGVASDRLPKMCSCQVPSRFTSSRAWPFPGTLQRNFDSLSPLQLHRRFSHCAATYRTEKTTVIESHLHNGYRRRR